jgi:hypothetical protein
MAHPPVRPPNGESPLLPLMYSLFKDGIPLEDWGRVLREWKNLFEIAESALWTTLRRINFINSKMIEFESERQVLMMDIRPIYSVNCGVDPDTSPGEWTSEMEKFLEGSRLTFGDHLLNELLAPFPRGRL